MIKIFDFYRHDLSFRDDDPSYNYFDIVRNWSDDKWEYAHDFIQWVFPLKEDSAFNPDAPLLTDEDIAIFRVDKELQQDLFVSFHRFLRFLGLRCRYDQELDKWITELIRPGDEYFCGFDEKIFTKEQFEEKQKLWASPNHNWFRITRCLHCLRLLGFEYAAESLFGMLKKLYSSNLGITDNTFQYWQTAAQAKINFKSI